MNDAPPVPSRDPVTSARTLHAAHRHREALALLEGAGDTAAVRLLRAETWAGLERFRAAADLCLAIERDPAATTPERLRAARLRARLLLGTSPFVDAALELATEVADEATRHAANGAPELRELAGLAHLEAAHGFARKRCRGLAERELQAARGLLGENPRVATANGRLLLAFDERVAARAQFAAAMGSGTEGRRMGLLGLALIDFLLGNFDSAHAHLDQLEPLADDDREAKRLRVRLFLATARFGEAVALLDELLQRSPDADTTFADRYERATAFYHGGQRDAATRAFGDLGPADSGDALVQRALRHARLLARDTTAVAENRRLAAFPSVVQLRDHCGPAAVELYLRFFGVRAEQLEVARAIKHPAAGTPVYRMRRYLEAAGFATRRIEAELPTLRRLIDAGIPVILEEDYSESRHVAVAMGYDDAREVLLVQDPMSHDVRETPYENLVLLRAMSNFGALVAVPRAEEARLTASGAEECRYMALVDEAWAARDLGKPEDGDRLVTEALALRRDYELAWLYRFHRARAFADAAGPGDSPARQQLRGVVAEIEKLWPDDEWPQQLLGEVLFADRRLPEALQAFERARDRDPADARNWAMIADCHLAAGRDDQAHAALGQALLRDTAHRGANGAQAWHYHRLGRQRPAWIANEVARELMPAHAWNHSIHAILLAARENLEHAIAAYTRAAELAPQQLGFVVERARLMARMGRVDEAAATLAAAVRQHSQELTLRVDLADLLYRHGRNEAAIAVCQELRALDANHQAAYAIAGAALCQSGRLDEGIAELRKALALRPTFSWALAELGKFVGRAGRHADALHAYAAAFGLSGSAAHELGIAHALSALGWHQDAARRARSAVTSGKLPAEEWDLAAAILSAGEGLQPAHQLLDEQGQKEPRNTSLQRAHVRLLLERYWTPAQAMAPLRRLAAMAPADPFVMAAQGAMLMDGAPDGHSRGEGLLRSAIAQDASLMSPRRLLATRLHARGRHAEVLDVLPASLTDFLSIEQRVLALLRLHRPADAGAAVAAFEANFPRGSEPPTSVRMLRFHMAWHHGDWAAALALAETVSREFRERDDDGHLDSWEEAKFECLLRLGEGERARRFGEQQAGDAGSAGRLARAALRTDARDLAAHFVARALYLDPAEPVALAVQARLASAVGA